MRVWFDIRDGKGWDGMDLLVADLLHFLAWGAVRFWCTCDVEALDGTGFSFSFFFQLIGYTALQTVASCLVVSLNIFHSQLIDKLPLWLQGRMRLFAKTKPAVPHLKKVTWSPCAT